MILNLEFHCTLILTIFSRMPHFSMLNITRFKLNRRVCLKHSDKCYLIAIDLLRNIYVEEYYDEAYIAQHSISAEGELLKSIDENYGKSEISPLKIPENAILPQNPLDHPLNFTGMRFRGMREEEKVMEWVKPLSVMEKMPLLQALQLTISPMMIFGIAESRVLSETKFSATETILCRRIRLLQALAEVQLDEAGLPYDYDTITFQVIQSYDTETETASPFLASIQYFSELSQPMDCIYSDGRLIVANAGDDNNPAAVHIFQYQENEAQI